MGDGGAFDFHYIKDDGGQKNIFSDFLRLMLSEIETAHVLPPRACAISFWIPFINLVYSLQLNNGANSICPVSSKRG